MRNLAIFVIPKVMNFSIIFTFEATLAQEIDASAGLGVFEICDINQIFNPDLNQSKDPSPKFFQR